MIDYAHSTKSSGVLGTTQHNKWPRIKGMLHSEILNKGAKFLIKVRDKNNLVHNFDTVYMYNNYIKS